MMINKKFEYFGLVNRIKSPGVAKKIDNTVIAARSIGLNASGHCFPTNLGGVKSFLKSLAYSKSDFIMIRFSDLVSPVVFFIMMYLRLRGVKIIIDVPTPRVVGLKELDSAIDNNFYRIMRKSMSYMTGAWVFYPAHRVVQYASESEWFEFGVKYKTIKIGNGILISDKIPLVQSVWPADELKLIGVAQLASWHGYDRLIRALLEVNKKNLPYKISFTIVGDGAERPILETLVQELGLQEQVSFTGMLTGEDLDNIFSDKHIGVASLGLYRIGLDEASVLKTREYITRGLPVIGVGEDPDFQKDSPYRFLVANDDNIDDIVQLLINFHQESFLKPSVLREFALTKLSLKSKIHLVLSGL